MRHFGRNAGLLGVVVASLLVALSYQEQGSDGKGAAAPTPTLSVGSSPGPVSSALVEPSQDSSPDTSASTSSSTPPASPKYKPIAPARPTKLEISAIGLTVGFGSPIVSTHDAAGWTITPPEATWDDLQRVYWWSETKYSVLPSSPSKGATFIFGHACSQVTCAFNRLKDLTKGDLINATTPNGVLTYRVTAKLKLDKTPQGVGNSQKLYSYGTPNQLRLVTCGYTAYGASPFNWAIIAELAPSGS